MLWHSVAPGVYSLVWHWGTNLVGGSEGIPGVFLYSSPPEQNGHHFTNNIFQIHFCEWKVLILINKSLNFVPKGQINNIPALVQIMAWRRVCHNPLAICYIYIYWKMCIVIRCEHLRAVRCTSSFKCSPAECWCMYVCINELGHHWFS